MYESLRDLKTLSTETSRISKKMKRSLDKDV